MDWWNLEIEMRKELELPLLPLFVERYVGLYCGILFSNLCLHMHFCELTLPWRSEHSSETDFFQLSTLQVLQPLIRYRRWVFSNFQRLGTMRQDQLCLLLIPLISRGSPRAPPRIPPGFAGTLWKPPLSVIKTSILSSRPALKSFLPLDQFLAVRHNLSPELFCPSNIVLFGNLCC